MYLFTLFVLVVGSISSRAGGDDTGPKGAAEIEPILGVDL